MIQKGTYVSPADSCGVIWVKVFHLYYGFNRKVAKTGSFIKSSVKETKPNNWLVKKSKVKGIVIRTQKELKKVDGTTIKFKTNSVILLKKRMNTYGNRLVGPIPSTIRRRKFLNSFPGRI